MNFPVTTERKWFRVPFMVGWRTAIVAASLPHSLMTATDITKFLTVKEAALHTGRSTSSIRRVIYPILGDDKHADRSLIAPSVEGARALRIKGENFAWRISQKLLDRLAPVKAAANQPASAAGGAGDEPPVRELVALLRDQLQQAGQQLSAKDQQIATLSEIAKSLNERVREGNILIGNLQRQLSPPSPPASATEATEVRPESTPAPQAGSKKTATKPVPPSAKKPAKKGVWSRLFA